MCRACETTIRISFRRPYRLNVLAAAAEALGGRATHGEDSSTIELPVADDLPRRWREAVVDARVDLPLFGVADKDLECGWYGWPTVDYVPKCLRGTYASEPRAWAC